MRSVTLCLIAAVLLAGCNDKPSMSATDRKVCDAQASGLATVRSVMSSSGAPQSTQVLGPTDTAVSQLIAWENSADSPKLKQLLAGAADRLTSVNIEAQENNAVTDTASAARKALDDLSAFCGST